MITKVKELKNGLLSKGVKPTHIRLKIFEYVKNNPVHPDADTVYSSLKKELPVLSKTSVYNTLKLFASKGLIIKLTALEGKVNFDGNSRPHFHFACSRCLKLYDLDMDSELFNRKNIEDHRITQMHGYFKGVCRSCLKECPDSPGAGRKEKEKEELK